MACDSADQQRRKPLRRGRLQGDGQLILELRDLLHHHGVSLEKTEESATLAIKKIGEGAIEKALHSRNPWAALKALRVSAQIQLSLGQAG